MKTVSVSVISSDHPASTLLIKIKISDFKDKNSFNKRFVVCMHAKMALPNLQRYPRKLCLIKYKLDIFYSSELKTLEWWISGLRLNPLFFLICRLNIACSPLIFNLQINYPIRIKDIPFKSSHLRSNNGF